MVAQPGRSGRIRSGGGFRDADAGGEHVNSKHFAAFVASAPALLSATPLIISQSVDADGWAPMGEITVGG